MEHFKVRSSGDFSLMVSSCVIKIQCVIILKYTLCWTRWVRN